MTMKNMSQKTSWSPELPKCSLWRFCVQVQKFVSLFWAKEIIRLVAVFAAMWGCGFLTHLICGSGWLDSIGEGFRSLFSLNNEGCGSLESFFLGIWFFVVWLIGGGVLVSVMVAQQRRNDNGEFRLQKCLLRDYVIFLGWDENVPSLMSKELCQGEHADKKIFIVVTMTPSDDVMKSVEAASIEKWRLFVYRGFYDDNGILKQLYVNDAVSLYIMGESREEAHDSRVILLAKNLSLHFAKTDSHNCIFANIKDFGLANMLMAGAKIKPLRNVSWINFHLDSSNYLLSRVKGDEALSHVLVIGFGAMGKAIVVKGLAGGIFSGSSIYVSDDDETKLDMEKDRFDAQFPEFKLNVIKYSYAKAIAMLNGAQDSEKWLVVVAKHRSEKGFAVMLDVLAAIKGKSCFKLALNQEVKCDHWQEHANDNAFLDVDGFRVELFGFRSGDFHIAH